MPLLLVSQSCTCSMRRPGSISWWVQLEQMKQILYIWKGKNYRFPRERKIFTVCLANIRDFVSLTSDACQLRVSYDTDRTIISPSITVKAHLSHCHCQSSSVLATPGTQGTNSKMSTTWKTLHHSRIIFHAPQSCVTCVPRGFLPIFSICFLELVICSRYCKFISISRGKRVLIELEKNLKTHGWCSH